MKKQFFTLITLTAICLNVIAQSSSKKISLLNAGKSKNVLALRKAGLSLPQTAINYYWNVNTWNLQDTSLMTYDANGNIIAKTTIYNGGNKYKQLTTYNNFGYTVLNTNYNYVGNDWVLSNGDSTVVTYNTSNLITNANVYYFNGVNWMLNEKNTVTYNGSNVTELISEYYNSFDSTWQKNQTTITYANNKPNEFTEYNWENNEWVPQMLAVNLEWENWYGYSSKNFDIFEAGTIKGGLVFNWNGITWDTSMSVTSNYDANGGYVQTISQYDGGVFVPLERYTVVNDEKRNTIEEKDEDWENNKWVIANGNKYLHTYDNESRILQTIDQGWHDTSYVNSQKHVYSNFVNLTGLTKIAKSIEVSAYPNPFTQNTTITLGETLKGNSQVVLMDNLGRVLQTVDFTNNSATINRNGLNSGIYFANIVNNGNIVATKKVVLQ